MIRRGTPANSEARLAMRASVGPILPATPSNIKSPFRFRIVSTAPGVGSLNRVSRSATDWIGDVIAWDNYIETPKWKARVRYESAGFVLLEFNWQARKIRKTPKS